MTRKKTTALSAALLGIVLSGVFFTKGYPIVFTSGELVKNNPGYNSPVFNPLQGYDLNEGTWAVYLIIDKSDFSELTSALPPYKLWKVNDVAALKNMQATWNFKPTGGDMATVASSMIIVHDQKIVFEAGIVLDENVVGLQSREFGWAEWAGKENFTKSLKDFRKVLSPVVFL